MTALTLQESLSLVMTSCGGTSIVTVLRLTFIIFWMPGMRTMSPGPFTAWNLPRKNITPLSYSGSIFIALHKKSSPRPMSSRVPMPIPNSITFPLVLQASEKAPSASLSLSLVIAAYMKSTPHFSLLDASHMNFLSSLSELTMFILQRLRNRPSIRRCATSSLLYLEQQSFDLDDGYLVALLYLPVRRRVPVLSFYEDPSLPFAPEVLTCNAERP